jgi:hypothetical protein
LEYEQSGQTRGVFCRAHGISLATLDNYRKRRGCIAGTETVEQNTPFVEKGHSSTHRSAMALVPVEVIESPSVAATVTPREATQSATLFVELSRGRRIGVVSGFDATTLMRLIAVLDEV